MGADNGLWWPLERSPVFQELEGAIRAGERGLCLTGLVVGARALVLHALLARGAGRFLLVAPDDAAVDAWQRDLAGLGGLSGGAEPRTAVLPALDADPYDAIAPHPEVVRERAVTLGRLIRGEVDLLLLPARALLQPLPGPETWRSWVRVFRAGDTLAPDRFVLEAIELGYRRVDIVSAPGEISRRGGIVDVFPPDAAEPVRIELFGDTIESLRSFDTDHQRSTGGLERVVVGPATENPPTDEAVRRLLDRLERRPREAESARSARRARELLEQLRQQGSWPGFEALAAITAERPVSVLDLADDMALVVDEPARAVHELARAVQDQRTAWDQSDLRLLPPPERLLLDPRALRERLAEARVLLQELGGEEPAEAIRVWPVASRGARAYSGRVADLAADLVRSRESGVRVVFAARAPGSAERLREILREYGLDPASGGLYVGVAGLRSGFELPELGLVVLSERDVFGEERPAADRRSGGRAAFVSDFRDLKVGAPVVHVDHGVARYAGLGRPKGGSLNRDFMVLEFVGGDRLFVPADRLDLVQKYNGVAGHEPQLDRLGGLGWERVKSRVRKAVESMARELLELYARRRAARGNAFGPDTPWQAELEAAFPFELTPDQQRAVAEIKADMETDRPMDRLLVGDVGFGKTEVAVRAAFKAVQDGYQVAVLAPTTVLAAQHFETFRERYAPFPVRVEVVSRFRSPGETAKALRDLELGAVDVLIGTHRLLSKDVRFRKLGLLVVDEEQRFGVAHKERLKRMTIGVDILAMTATPIPRTLQMSLAGVRDLSVIETPPPGRLAIQSYVVPFRPAVIGQAIRQELRRGGQVFVVHNRIETLPAIARAVQRLAPDARIGIAHGQMNEHRLERVMLDFVRQRTDVLVTTTIVENGLHIPRANTLIVNRADRFGLAQLYQLRGRVGRSHQHAYAYFVVPSREHLAGEARKRLQALQEFSELGAGFRLAAADLEIRGAGELLGSRQHGHIAALGFDLYCQMLEQAVRELQGEPTAEARPVSLHLGVDIKIPESYLPEAGDRLVVYKRLAQARDAEAIDRLQAETEDRYGHLPTATRSLFALGRLRLLAEAVAVKSVDLVEDTLQVRFHDRPPVDPARVIELVAQERGNLTPAGTVVLPAPPQGADRIETAAGLMRRLLEFVEPREQGRPA